MVSKKAYVTEWMQSLVIATSLALVSVIIFISGGFDLATENGRAVLFLWMIGIGMIATYLALFKFRRGLTEGVSGGFL